MSFGTVVLKFHFEPPVSSVYHPLNSNPGFVGCATSSRYAISTSTTQGRNVLSTVLSAKAASLTITVTGMDVCTAHSDAEDVNWLYVN